MRSFVDRDMFMRYYWGFAAGHTYAHSMRNGHPATQFSAGINEANDSEPETSSGDGGLFNQQDGDVQYDNNPEFGFQNRQDDVIDDEGEISGDEGSIDDDEEFFAINDMYGTGNH
jgi:hypothetical protein